MKRQTTRNPRPPITVQGHMDIPVCEVLTLEAKDRPEYTPGQPILINKLRYILTRREPAEVGESGAKVYIVLGRDKSTRMQRRKRAHQCA